MSSTPEPVFVWEGGVLHPVSYDPDPEPEVNQDDEEHERRTLATDAEITQLLRNERLYRENEKLRDVIIELNNEIRALERAKYEQGVKHKNELEAKHAEIMQLLKEKIELLEINARQGCQLTAWKMYHREQANGAQIVPQNTVTGANGNNANEGGTSVIAENPGPEDMIKELEKKLSCAEKTIKKLEEKLEHANKAAMAMRALWPLHRQVAATSDRNQGFAEGQRGQGRPTSESQFANS
jgi:predicted RNase H-like nuclease (RuvC/YqgF family)